MTKGQFAGIRSKDSWPGAHFAGVRSKVIPPKHQQAPPSFVVYDHNEWLVLSFFFLLSTHYFGQCSYILWPILTKLGVKHHYVWPQVLHDQLGIKGYQRSIMAKNVISASKCCFFHKLYIMVTWLTYMQQLEPVYIGYTQKWGSKVIKGVKS